MTERFESPTKPARCPKCGSARIANIIYGYPAFSEGLEADRAAGRVTLGGSFASDNDPVWQCADCRIKICQPGKRPDPEMAH